MVEDVFLEFVPEDRWEDDRPPRLTLAEVECDVRYVMVITTPAGLYAYAPGDVVRFLSTEPPRMLVEGRYGHVLNLAAEKLDEVQAEQALDRAGLGWERALHCGGRLGRRLGQTGPRSEASGDSAAPREGAQRRKCPLRQGTREQRTL